MTAVATLLLEAQNVSLTGKGRNSSPRWPAIGEQYVYWQVLANTLVILKYADI